MEAARPGRDVLDRSLRTSWIVALVLAAVLVPLRPYDALAVLAGQLIAFLHFVFLRKIVKLFTDARHPSEGQARSGSALPLVITAKVLLVYGGLFGIMAWGRLRYASLCAGFALPFAVLFLKAMMLAFGAGPASLTRRHIKQAISSTMLLLALTLFASATPAQAQTTGPAQHEELTPNPSQPAPAAHPETGEGQAAASESHAAEAPEGASHAEGAATELPNWLVLLHDFNHGNPVVDWLEKNQILVFAWFSGLLFLFISWLAMRNPKMVPGPFQNAIEWMVESMEEIAGGLLGEKHIKRHFPIIGALFFYILTINMLGILPGMKSATSSLDLTLALALITFLYVQFWGVRNLGIVGYLDHLAGSPRDAIGWMMLPVMLPVHILGELAKPVSLSCRLFGNIFGEDTLIVVFVGATAMLLKWGLSLLAVPPMAGITALFMMLQTLTSIVQALIFSLLATVYLYMMLPHETHAHEEAHASH
jgi:F-type H+-transporting ATPase subunit a